MPVLQRPSWPLTADSQAGGFMSECMLHYGEAALHYGEAALPYAGLLLTHIISEPRCCLVLRHWGHCELRVPSLVSTPALLLCSPVRG